MEPLPFGSPMADYDAQARTLIGRFDWEIIVDANGPEEQALGWCYTSDFYSKPPW